MNRLEETLNNWHDGVEKLYKLMLDPNSAADVLRWESYRDGFNALISTIQKKTSGAWVPPDDDVGECLSELIELSMAIDSSWSGMDSDIREVWNIWAADYIVPRFDSWYITYFPNDDDEPQFREKWTIISRA